MKNPFQSLRSRWLSGLALLFLTAAPAAAQEQMAGIVSKNRLAFFLSTEPGSVELLKVTGLAPGEKLIGIDRRPATGQLYALGNSSRIYTINLETGAATMVGTGPFTPAISGKHVAFDFNPVADRIRIVTNKGQSLRVHPDTGVVAFTDLNVAYPSTDTGFGSKPLIGAGAYTNSVSPTPATTTLYNIDSRRDVLVTQNPPNDGTLNTVGGLSVNVSDVGGFDIAQDGTAYGAFQIKLAFLKLSRSYLYTVNLTTGTATVVGKIGGPSLVTGLTSLGPVVVETAE